MRVVATASRATPASQVTVSNTSNAMMLQVSQFAQCLPFIHPTQQPCTVMVAVQAYIMYSQSDLQHRCLVWLLLLFLCVFLLCVFGVALLARVECTDGCGACPQGTVTVATTFSSIAVVTASANPNNTIGCSDVCCKNSFDAGPVCCICKLCMRDARTPRAPA